MKTYVLFFIVFLLSFSVYSQTGGGMRKGGGRGTGTQTMGEGQGTSKGLQRDQRVKSAGREVIVIQEAGAPELKPVVQPGLERELVLEQELVPDKISQPNIRTNVRVNTGVRSF